MEARHLGVTTVHDLCLGKIWPSLKIQNSKENI